MPLDDATLGALLDLHAPARPVPLAPAIVAWQAEDELPLWRALEEALGVVVGPPFFALVWPGAQTLARALFAGRLELRDARVVDVGAGSGVAAVAAALCGARARAIDVDPLAAQAARILAARHHADIEAVAGDALANDALLDDADVLLAGDLVSSERHAAPARRAIERFLARGQTVVLADSGRPFFDAVGLPCIEVARVAVPRAIDGVVERDVRLYAAGPRLRSTAS
jgi:predicted nicotinamide N-methyase